MDTSAWTQKNADPARARRFWMGAGIGVLSVLLAGASVRSTADLIGEKQEEDAVDVSFADSPEPEPEPVAPPPPEELKPKPRPAPRLVVPTALPDAPPPEADVKPGSIDVPLDPFEQEPVEKPAPPSPPSSPPPPPPPPKVRPPKVEKPEGPLRITENMVRPRCVVRPEFPEAARSQGIEGVVVARVVVDATGKITQIKILKGPEEFRASVLAALKQGHCTPATLEGVAVEVYKTFRFPFRLRQ